MIVPIDGSWFTMGSNDGQENERPVHDVWVDSFAIAAHTVTNAEFARFAPLPFGDDARFNDPGQPVIAISWNEAMSYCRWLSTAGDGVFRLPTEAEWECAARGGIEGKRYPWGDDPPEDHSRELEGPDRVGRREPNGYGLYDIGENVHEWCADWYGPDYYAVSPPRNPRGPESGVRRVSRGGSWRHRIKVTRNAARSSLPPDLRYTDFGFRVVREYPTSSLPHVRDDDEGM